MKERRRMRHTIAELFLFIAVCAALSDALYLRPRCCRMTRQYQQGERERKLRAGTREAGKHGKKKET